MRVTIVNSVTLDGVAQAPAAPDEDPRGGFQHGGWGRPYSDAVAAKAMAARMARPGPGALLLGRVTYERFYKVWPARTADGNPYSEPPRRRPRPVRSSRRIDAPDSASGRCRYDPQASHETGGSPRQLAGERSRTSHARRAARNDSLAWRSVQGS